MSDPRNEMSDYDALLAAIEDGAYFGVEFTVDEPYSEKLDRAIDAAWAKVNAGERKAYVIITIKPPVRNMEVE